MADGTERELAPGHVFNIPPGHDIWVIGDEPNIAIDVIAAQMPDALEGVAYSCRCRRRHVPVPVRRRALVPQEDLAIVFPLANIRNFA
jgi:hypothetical protein